jgi:hypothetical protein
MTGTNRRTFTAASLLAAPMLFLRGRSASAQLSEMPPTPRSEGEQIALDAYVYGYSLITTEVTRIQRLLWRGKADIGKKISLTPFQK